MSERSLSERSLSEHSLSGDPAEIYRWRRIDDRLTTSGQPDETQLATLAHIGITHVVNLGLHSHEQALPDEAGSVAALGMAYVHIPVDFGEPDEEDYLRFRTVMRELAGRNVHVHCIANLRVSAFLYRYRREEGLVPEREAREEMEQLWRPGGAWAAFIGDDARRGEPHHYPGRDYRTSAR